MSTEFYPLTLSQVETLNKDAVALSFSVPSELIEKFNYIQGQHLTIKAQINGEEVRRSYSICSNVLDQKLQVGVKRLEGGLFSNYANDELKKGMTLDVMPPQGHFYTELSANNSKNYLFIAAGSGITPNLSHIQSILSLEPDSSVTLIYGNKTTPLMMFKEKLCFIKNQYLERFQWVNLFTREDHEVELMNGRISAEKLQALSDAHIINLKSYDDVFICGPESLIHQLSESFIEWNYHKDQIHYELFFSDAAEENAQQHQLKRSEKYGHKTSTVSIKVAGRKTIIQLAAEGTNILEAGLEQGADLPFSCKGGVCATCKAKVIKGKVEMDLNHSLTEEEVADGMILTCQSHPVTEEVEIDFDFN